VQERHSHSPNARWPHGNALFEPRSRIGEGVAGRLAKERPPSYVVETVDIRDLILCRRCGRVLAAVGIPLRTVANMPHCEKSTIYILEREAGRPEMLYDLN
jgi:hypothetical protein